METYTEIARKSEYSYFYKKIQMILTVVDNIGPEKHPNKETYLFLMKKWPENE